MAYESVRTRFQIWLVAALTAVGPLAIATSVVAFQWLRAVLHGHGVVAYVCMFYVLVVLLLMAIRSPWQSGKRSATLAAMFVLGHFAAAATAFTLHISQHDGVERLRNTIAHDGLLDFAIGYLLLSAGLGGWLLAPLALLGTAAMAKRFAR